MHTNLDAAANIIISYIEEKDPLKSALHIAAEKGNIDLVNQLIAQGTNVDAKTSNGDTALHIAAREGKNEIIKALINAGANTEKTDDDGNTPLHISAKFCCFTSDNTIKTLIECGANIKAKNKNEDTPLLFAIRNGNNVSINDTNYI